MSRGNTLSIEQLQFQYAKHAFKFSLNLDKGNTVALIGPSGAGKSTLLHLIAGLLAPSGGQLEFDGANLLPLAPYQRPVSMLFQDNNLFSHLTVEQNIALGINPSLSLSPTEKERVCQVARDVGLESKLKQLPQALSGGQRQRVALARCCAQQKPLWLLDEPFSALDPELRLEMLELVKTLAEKQNLTVVMVTHQVTDALRIADKYVFIEQGNVLSQGNIEQLQQLKNEAKMGAQHSLERFLASSS